MLASTACVVIDFGWRIPFKKHYIYKSIVWYVQHACVVSSSEEIYSGVDRRCEHDEGMPGVTKGTSNPS